MSEEVSTAPVVGETAEAPVAEAGSSSSQKPATPTPEEIYVLKVNGKEVKVPKSKLEMYAQLGLASDEKFKDGAPTDPFCKLTVDEPARMVFALNKLIESQTNVAWVPVVKTAVAPAPVEIVTVNAPVVALTM